MNDNEKGKQEMATINLETILKGPDGSEFKNKQELGPLLSYSLNQKQEKQTDSDMRICQSLRERIFKGGEIELTKNEINLLIDQVHSAENVDRLSLSAAIEILEG